MYITVGGDGVITPINDPVGWYCNLKKERLPALRLPWNVKEPTVGSERSYVFVFSQTGHTVTVTSSCSSETGFVSTTVLEEYIDQSNLDSFPKVLLNLSVKNGSDRLGIYFFLFKPVKNHPKS